MKLKYRLLKGEENYKLQYKGLAATHMLNLFIDCYFILLL